MPQLSTDKELSEQEIYEIILDRLDLHSQNNFYHCPFHTDNHPSLSIDKERGIYHCFSCQAKGTLRGLFYQIKGYGINKELGIHKNFNDYKPYNKEETISKRTEKSEEFQSFVLKEESGNIEEFELPDPHIVFNGSIVSIENSDIAKNYLKKRKIPIRVAERMGFKYSLNSYSYDIDDPTNKRKFIYFNNRLLIPVYEKGKLISCEGRNPFSEKEFENYYKKQGKHPREYKKCIYPKGSSTNTLFQLDKLDRSKELFVVEGIMDLAILRTDSFFNEKNSTSTFGCALTKRQLKLLSEFDNVTFILDNDKAGWSESRFILNYLKDSKLFKNWKFIIPPFSECGVKDIGDVPVKANKTITECLNMNWLNGKKSFFRNQKLIEAKTA